MKNLPILTLALILGLGTGPVVFADYSNRPELQDALSFNQRQKLQNVIDEKLRSVESKMEESSEETRSRLREAKSRLESFKREITAATADTWETVRDKVQQAVRTMDIPGADQPDKVY